MMVAPTMITLTGFLPHRTLTSICFFFLGITVLMTYPGARILDLDPGSRGSPGYQGIGPEFFGASDWWLLTMVAEDSTLNIPWDNENAHNFEPQIAAHKPTPGKKTVLTWFIIFNLFIDDILALIFHQKKTEKSAAQLNRVIIQKLIMFFLVCFCSLFPSIATCRRRFPRFAPCRRQLHRSKERSRRIRRNLVPPTAPIARPVLRSLGSFHVYMV